MRKFSKITCDRILNYVYVIKTRKPYFSESLQKNIDINQIVYVGKGKDNRAFSHRKRSWYVAGDCIEEFVSVQLTAETAEHVESALISIIGLENLENDKSGRQSQKRLSIDDVKLKFDIQPLVLDPKDVGHTLLVVFTPKKGEKNVDLYERASGWWIVSKSKAPLINTILMMHRDTRKIIAVVENIERFQYLAGSKNRDRCSFDNANGQLSKNSKYLGKWVGHIRYSSQNPIQYL